MIFRLPKQTSHSVQPKPWHCQQLLGKKSMHKPLYCKIFRTVLTIQKVDKITKQNLRSPPRSAAGEAELPVWIVIDRTDPATRTACVLKDT